MNNLLKETLEVLESCGKTADDVLFVTDGERSCAWSNFSERAATIRYDDGFGGREIVGGLKVVGDDWWLERGEYDGSEWWEFKTLPLKGRPAKVHILVDEEDSDEL
jgi:hypothetical protein